MAHDSLFSIEGLGVCDLRSDGVNDSNEALLDLVESDSSDEDECRFFNPIGDTLGRLSTAVEDGSGELCLREMSASELDFILL